MLLLKMYQVMKAIKMTNKQSLSDKILEIVNDVEYITYSDIQGIAMAIELDLVQKITYIQSGIESDRFTIENIEELIKNIKGE